MKKFFALCFATLFAVCLLAGCAAKQTFTVSDGIINESGTYKVDASLIGGSGRASIESPVTIKVNNGTMEAVITWSSSNYDLMVVGGTEYTPSSTSGKSVFQIPISSLSEPLAFEAETTAMGAPHMIEYTITFDIPSTKAA